MAAGWGEGVRKQNYRRGKRESHKVERHSPAENGIEEGITGRERQLNKS